MWCNQGILWMCLPSRSFRSIKIKHNIHIRSYTYTRVCSYVRIICKWVKKTMNEWDSNTNKIEKKKKKEWTRARLEFHCARLFECSPCYDSMPMTRLTWKSYSIWWWWGYYCCRSFWSKQCAHGIQKKNTLYFVLSMEKFFVKWGKLSRHSISPLNCYRYNCAMMSEVFFFLLRNIDWKLGDWIVVVS